MSFGGLVLRNLVRQRLRTLLTLLGIAIGVTTVVALGAITGGVEKTSSEFVRAGGADFMVAQNGASDLSFSTVPVDDVRAVAARPDVAEANGVLMELTSVNGNPYFPFFGYERAALGGEGIALVRGRLPRRSGEAAVGTNAAGAPGVGDTIETSRASFRVVGVYRVADRFRSGGAIVLLRDAQALARKPGLVTLAHVHVAPGHDPARVARAIEDRFPQLTTIANADEYSKVDQGLKVLNALDLAISLLAVVIGAIGVMNTMVMSVFERTREIGILRAVGWRRSRVLRMVVAESLLLCILAAVVGTAFGILASRAVLLVPALSTYLVPTYPAAIFVRALTVAVAVALIGALYPAVRATRLSPMEALRHE